MVQAQIHLFLNAKGRKEFAGWLRFFGKVVRQFKGFVNIQLLQVEGASSLGLVLIFDTKAHMEAFFESPIFDQLMNRMRPHALQPYRKIILRAKNLYNYKKTETEKAAMRESGQKSVAQSMKVPLKPKAAVKSKQKPQQASKIEQQQKVVGMAQFMASRKQGNG